jgi:hypothetical protein
MMLRLIILTVIFSGSAFAQMNQFYKGGDTSSAVFGTSPNSIEEYLESRRNTGTIFTNPEIGTPQHRFNEPAVMMRDSVTIFNTPMDRTPVGNTPMGMPQSAPDIMIPAQPFGPALLPTPWGR